MVGPLGSSVLAAAEMDADSVMEEMSDAAESVSDAATDSIVVSAEEKADDVEASDSSKVSGRQ